MKRPQAGTKYQLDLIFGRVFYCPSCTTRRRTGSGTQKLESRTSRRSQSTWASSTAINGASPTPQPFAPLHEALVELRKNAPSYVNLSRLQLAIQSLESSRPTIRLAIIGLNVPDTAHRIARLLLADALEDEGKWEQILANGSQDYSRGLIVRYGGEDYPNILRPKTSVPILHVPSGLLQRNNVEILISSINGPSHDGVLQSRVQIPADTLLSPTIGTPTSESGRQVSIAQPAHKCLLVADGLDEITAVAELLASTKFASKEDRDSIMVVVNLESVILTNPDRKTLAINAKSAEQGLAAIRKSVSNAIEYEHKWIDGGMPPLSQWLQLTAARPVDDGNLAQPVKDLVLSILTAAASNLQAAALESSAALADRGLSLAVRTNLEEIIDQFSRSAHQELQSGLASAWRSRNWRKLAWYKLFWRVDDVGLIVTDLVNNAWLPRTERAVYELSGRLLQVGINPITEGVPPPSPEPGQAFDAASAQQEVPILQLDAQLATASIRAQSTQPVITNPIGRSNIQIQPIPQPIPIASSISRARSSYMYNAITSLTTSAQQLVFRTLSITGLSAGLSGLTYFSLFGTIYEAGTITAIGTVFALWTMQGGWQKATRQMENDLFDEGRSAIGDVVQRMRILVEQRSQVTEDPVEVEAREAVENVVNKARLELEKLDATADTLARKKSKS